MANAKTAQKILKTYMLLIGEHGFDEVSLARLAEEAEVSLPVLREHFGSKTDLVGGFAALIDQDVLSQSDPDMANEPARDRLFDVLMTRLDKLEPYKDGVRALLSALRKDPGLALEVNCIASRSQKWMLAAAGIDFNGLRGRLVAQGLAVSFGKVLRTWVEEEDPGMPRTMARLDRELDKGEDWLARINKAEKYACKLRKVGCKLQKARGKWGRRRHSGDMGADMGTGVPGDEAPSPAA